MPTSFTNITETWITDLRDAQPNTPIILVGTQIDLRDDLRTIQNLEKRREKAIIFAEGQKLARKLKLDVYSECSALTQKGLKNIFDEALVSVLAPKSRKEEEKMRSGLLSCLGR